MIVGIEIHSVKCKCDGRSWILRKDGGFPEKCIPPKHRYRLVLSEREWKDLDKPQILEDAMERARAWYPGWLQRKPKFRRLAKH